MSLWRRSIDLRIDCTNHCNLRCVMCHMSYQNRQPHSIGFDQFRHITNGVLDRVNVLFLSWGTEPLLNRDLPRILEYCSAARIPQIVLTTNLTLLTGEVAQALVKYVHTIHVSVDSADPDTFARLRRGAQLEVVLNNIRLLQDIKAQRRSRRPAIVFNTVVMAETLSGLAALVSLAQTLDVREINLTELTIPFGYRQGEGIDLHAQYVDTTEPTVRQRVREIFVEGKRRGVFVNYPGRLLSSRGIAKAAARINQAAAKLRSFTWRARIAMVLGYARLWFVSRNALCSYPWRQMTITPEGLVLPCCLWHDEDAMGRVGDAPLLRIWTNERFRQLRQQLASNNPPALCRSCRAGATKNRLGV